MTVLSGDLDYLENLNRSDGSRGAGSKGDRSEGGAVQLDGRDDLRGEMQ